MHESATAAVSAVTLNSNNKQRVSPLMMDAGATLHFLFFLLRDSTTAADNEKKCASDSIDDPCP
jgi:hypothetical protein